MCVFGDVVLKMHKSADASDLSEERMEPTGGMAATCSHTLSFYTIPF
jgi:hypothetical protein